MDENIDCYMEKAEKAYEEAVSMLGDMSSWEVYENCNELAAFLRNSPSGLDILKLEFFIPRNPKDVMDYIYGNLAEIHNKLHPDLVTEYGVLKTYSDTQRIRYEIIDAHIPVVSAREVLYFGVKLQLSEDVFALIETSVEHPQKPPTHEVVRVDLIYALHLCEKIDDKCHVVSLAYADPKGSIPKTFVNLGLSKRVGFYKTLIQEILKNTNQ